MAVDWKKVGTGMQGMGAWMQGQGPQWQAQQARQQELELQRKEKEQAELKAREQQTGQRMAYNIRMAKEKLQTDPRAAMNLLNEIKQGVPGASESPQFKKLDRMVDDTIKASMSGNQQAVPGILRRMYSELDAMDSSFVGRGYIPPAAASKPTVLSPGEKAFDQQGNVLYENPESVDQTNAQRPKAQDVNGRWRYLDDGSLAFPNATPVRQADKDRFRTRADSIYAPYNEVQSAYNRVKAVGENGTAASDLALIFNYMKLLDPRSVVRETEFQAAADARGWLARLEEEDQGMLSRVPAAFIQFIQKADTGATLLPEQRKDFLEQAKFLANSAAQQPDIQFQQALGQLDQDGLDAVEVFGEEMMNQYRERVRYREELARKQAEEAERARQEILRRSNPNAPQAPASPAEQYRPANAGQPQTYQSYLDMVERQRQR